MFALALALGASDAFAEPQDSNPESGQAQTMAGGSDDATADLVTMGTQESITYVKRSWDGSKVVSENAYMQAVSVPANGSMTSGAYYLDSNVTVDKRITLEGDTDLILGDGYTLDVEGIYIPQGSTLTIYAQSDGKNAGKIISDPDGGSVR